MITCSYIVTAVSFFPTEQKLEKNEVTRTKVAVWKMSTNLTHQQIQLTCLSSVQSSTSKPNSWLGRKNHPYNRASRAAELINSRVHSTDYSDGPVEKEKTSTVSWLLCLDRRGSQMPPCLTLMPRNNRVLCRTETEGRSPVQNVGCQAATLPRHTSSLQTSEALTGPTTPSRGSCWSWVDDRDELIAKAAGSPESQLSYSLSCKRSCANLFKPGYYPTLKQLEARKTVSVSIGSLLGVCMNVLGSQFHCRLSK